MTNEEGKPDFGPGDFSVDEKARQVFLSEDGHQKVEEMLAEIGLLAEGESLYDPANIVLHAPCVRGPACPRPVPEERGVHRPRRRRSSSSTSSPAAPCPVGAGPRACTRRSRPRSGCAIQQENQTLASITFQNLFRLYPKLSGMTGTADTEAYEFQQIYGLEVVVIPTNQPMIRKDNGDLVYLTAKEKYEAIVEDVQRLREARPAGPGGHRLHRDLGVDRQAPERGQDPPRGPQRQAARARGRHRRPGRAPGAVTIATNMAGRGTDIVLGGNLESELEHAGPEADEAAIRAAWKERHAEVLAAGGLHVVGTERHESRRIDNQLRGRSGRQGDPGSSRFYLSLEDNLMRIFASERVSSLMQKLGMQHGEAIEHPWVTKAIENAQRKVEGRNFDIRKQLLEYDDVANDQRKVIYRQRRDLMDAESVSETVNAMREDVLTNLITPTSRRRASRSSGTWPTCTRP